MFLKAMISWYNNLFLNNKFSEFAYLCNLSQYHLTDIQNRLSGIWREEISVYEAYQIVTWSNKNSSYSIYYTLSGKFIQIKEEKWVNEKLTFSYELKPELNPELNPELLYFKEAV